jgi:hypothetical protein
MRRGVYAIGRGPVLQSIPVYNCDGQEVARCRHGVVLEEVEDGAEASCACTCG